MTARVFSINLLFFLHTEPPFFPVIIICPVRKDFLRLHLRPVNLRNHSGKLFLTDRRMLRYHNDLMDTAWKHIVIAL